MTNKTPPHSTKVNKRGDRVVVRVQLPRSTPSSVVNIDADNKGFRLDTGGWGGGYMLRLAWPQEVEGRVKAGIDVEVDAKMEAGVVSVGFDVEPEGGAMKATKRKRGKEEEEEEETAKKKKKKTKAAGGEAKHDNKAATSTKHKTPAAGAGKPKQAAKQSTAEAAGREKKEKKEKAKGRALVESKADVLELAEAVGGKGEAKTQAKLQQERAREDKISQIQAKQRERHAAKQSKREGLLAQVRQTMATKKKKSVSAEPEEAAAPDVGRRSRKRVSWGQDEMR